MTPTQTGTKVIIAGAGIAGPVLATFLKHKGYHPVVYERTTGISDRGIGHGISANGLRVLAKIEGLLDTLESAPIDKFLTYSVVDTDKRLLLDFPAPTTPDGLRTIALRRSVLHHAVVGAAVRAGVEIVWGHKLVGVAQREDGVDVTFENGARDSASFVVGCDGLHSNTRSCLFGEEKADYTGLVQIGGICPTPEVLEHKTALVNIFGVGSHMIGLPVSKTHHAWAATLKQSEELKETWNAVDERIADEIRNSPMTTWEYGGGDFIKNTDRFVKYGIYDRPELKTWHTARVLLIGDAAHPTSPHLGQGANQSFEDVDMLIALLEKHNPSAGAPSTATLDAVFSELEAERIPRTAAQVKAARKMGENRVVDGLEAALQRNRDYEAMWKDEETIRRVFART